MKRILTENNINQEAEDEKRLQLSQLFSNATFEDLIKKTQPKVLSLYLFINKFFDFKF